jgi:hypothetical protein
MAEEAQSSDVERVKRYLQWATILVIVVIVVCCIDLLTKQAILKAVKEADGKLKAIPRNSTDTSPVQSVQPVGDATRATENGSTDATIRVSRTGPPKSREEAGQTGHVGGTDEGSANG